MGGEGQILKRIPRIRFPQRRPNSSNSGSTSQSQHEISVNKDMDDFIFSSSDVPAPPRNTAVGGRATLQPKRTPVSDREIEAILLRHSAQSSEARETDDLFSSLFKF